jgi:hypothetical protein
MDGQTVGWTDGRKGKINTPLLETWSCRWLKSSGGSAGAGRTTLGSGAGLGCLAGCLARGDAGGLLGGLTRGMVVSIVVAGT